MAETRTVRRPRRPSRDEDEPRSRRGRDEDDSNYEDPEEPEERPARRASSRPTRRAAPEANSRRDADDDDDAPAPRRGEGVKGGWGTWRQRKAESSSFADDFKVEYNEKYLIMILAEAPFAAFNQHWCDELPKGVKKSWPCIGKGCPLCEALGEKPSARAMFNVVEFIEDEKGGREGFLKVWEIGGGVAPTLEEISNDTGLEGNYFKVYKTKKGRNGPTDYHVIPVKERDLPDDWDWDGLTDEEVEGFMKKRFDGSYVQMPTKAKLREIAEQILDNED